MDKLSSLCKNIHYRVYTHLGRVYIEPEGEPYTIQGYNISQSNIKREIEVTTDSRMSSDRDSVTKDGITVTTFLNGRIKLPQAITLTDTVDHVGTYFPTSITHIMDTEGDNWDTKIKMMKGDANAQS